MRREEGRLPMRAAIPPQVDPMYSYLIRGAVLVDGSGNPGRRAEVAVAGDRIAEVAENISGPAAEMVDGGGLVLAPGFIDIHSHTDATLFRYPNAQSKLFQGVTVEVTGNCGLGLFPVTPGRERELADFLSLHGFVLPAGGAEWEDFRSYADHVDRLGPGVNIAPLVGHALLRIAAMGMNDRPSTAAELGEMERLLESGLAQGAWGMSTGLIYPPGSYAGEGELTALARVLAGRSALYASHIRNEGDGLMAALAEAVSLGRNSGARVQVSHLKAMGREMKGRGPDALALLASARDEGIDIGADQYPYAASATSLSAVVPPWAHEGGVAPMLARLRDRAVRGRLLAEIGEAIASREGAAGIMVGEVRSGRNLAWSGQTLDRVAAAWGCLPAEAVVRLVLEEEGGVGAIYFSMAESDVAAILADPHVAVGSDGHGLDAASASGEATHPRSYGAFPRVLGRYVRDERLLSLEVAIYKMTALPARRIGFPDRGMVRPGFVADLVLFDPAGIGDAADYASPHRYSAGIVHLFMDGRPVIRDGELTGLGRGKVVRRRSSRQ